MNSSAFPGPGAVLLDQVHSRWPTCCSPKTPTTTKRTRQAASLWKWAHRCTWRFWCRRKIETWWWFWRTATLPARTAPVILRNTSSSRTGKASCEVAGECVAACSHMLRPLCPCPKVSRWQALGHSDQQRRLIRGSVHRALLPCARTIFRHLLPLQRQLVQREGQQLCSSKFQTSCHEYNSYKSFFLVAVFFNLS